MFCQYKDALGKPHEGFHYPRIFGFALLDILGTVAIAYVLSLYSNMSFIVSFSFLMVLAIVLHKLFCVDTELNYILFGRSQCNEVANKKI